MLQKTLTFTKKPKDLSNNPEVGANIVKVGKLKFTMKGFKEINGHYDSLPYSAILCVDNKPLAHCYNDGWGGQTEINYISGGTNEIEKAISAYQWKYGKTKFDLHIDFIADILAQTCDMYAE